MNPMTHNTSLARPDPLHAPVLGEQIPRWGGRMARGLARQLMRLLGWRFAGAVPNLPKMVIIGAPHTSNWDWPLAMVALLVLGIRVWWMGKHTFVDGPLRPLLRRMGGVPINRTRAHGVVAQMVDEFAAREQFLLGLSPEGTRSYVPRWKMGFYHIARQANVPIVPISLDYGRRLIGIGPAIDAAEEETAVLAQIEQFYHGVTGKNPRNANVTPAQSANDEAPFNPND